MTLIEHDNVTIGHRSATDYRVGGTAGNKNTSVLIA